MRHAFFPGLESTETSLGMGRVKVLVLALQYFTTPKHGEVLSFFQFVWVGFDIAKVPAVQPYLPSARFKRRMSQQNTQRLKRQLFAACLFGASPKSMEDFFLCSSV
jgi:hypothetical protein